LTGDDIGLLYRYEYSETMLEELEQAFRDAATQLRAMVGEIEN
jgi:hypothetical protein